MTLTNHNRNKTKTNLSEVSSVKRCKTRACKSQLVLVLHLIGWESGARNFNRSQHLVKLNQSKTQITFDIQLKAALIIGHFRVVLCLFFRASLGAEPFTWKWVLFTCRTNSFSNERLCTKTCYEKEAQDNSGMAYLHATAHTRERAMTRRLTLSFRYLQIPWNRHKSWSGFLYCSHTFPSHSHMCLLPCQLKRNVLTNWQDERHAILMPSNFARFKIRESPAKLHGNIFTVNLTGSIQKGGKSKACRIRNGVWLSKTHV